jgi:outer membrane autotransporter protein
MFRLALKLYMGFALRAAVISLPAIPLKAQLFTAPPAPASGSIGNSLVVTGNVTINNLTLNVNFYPGNGVGVTVNNGTATLTNTAIDLGTSGGVKGLVVNGPNSTLIFGAGSSVIAAGGGGDFGVQVNGGTITLQDGAFVNMPGGGGSSQVTVDMSGTFNMTGGSLTVTGGGGDGVHAGDSSTPGILNLTNTAVTVLGSGGNSSGVWANISGSKATLVGTDITVSGSGGGNFGVKATNGAVADITGGLITIDATGGHNIGVLAGTTGTGTVTINSASVDVTGSNSSVGLQADGLNSTLSGAGNTIVTTGSNDIGALAQNSASMTLSSSSVTVNGTSGIGAEAQNSGTSITLDNKSSVTVNGTNGTGVLVQNTASAILASSTVALNGDNPTGIQLNNTGTISMTGGTVTTTGAAGQAIFVSGSGANSGTFIGTSVSSGSGNGILAQGSATSTLNFLNGASLTGGNGTLLLDQESGTVNLNAITNVNFVGDINAIDASGTANVTLQLTSTLTGAINQNTLTGASGINPADPFPFQDLPRQNVNLGVDGTSLWTMTASSTVNTLTVNPGARIVFPNPDQFHTLVINSLVGTGATFGMNIDLAAIKGDLISILTHSEGTHLITFSNLSQGADLPVNQALLVVQTPDFGAGFSGETDGGTYKYFLVHGDGSAVTPVHDNWYLVRGDEIQPGNETPPDNGGPTTPGDEFTNGDVGPTPEEVIPIPISPINDLTNAANAAIGSYSAIMPMFYADMGTLNERLGELRLQTQEQPPPSESNEQQGKAIIPNGKESKEIAPSPTPEASPFLGLDFWVRAFGSGSSFYNQASRNFFQDLGGFQFGADKRFITKLGDVYLGAFLGYFRASRDFLDGDGDGHTDAFSVGAYTTLVQPNGFYADLVVKHTYMWNEFEVPTIGEAVSTATANWNLPTVGASLEVGKRWDFGHFFLEPQGQIIGAWADSTSYTASNGLVVNGESQYSLRGRIGLRTGHTFNCGDKILEPFVTVSGGNEFLGSYTVSTDQTPFNPTLSGASVQAAIGLNARLSRSVYFYGQYEYDYSDKIRTPWSVNAGFSWQW